MCLTSKPPGAPFHASGACALLLHAPATWFHPRGARFGLPGVETPVSSPF